MLTHRLGIPRSHIWFAPRNVDRRLARGLASSCRFDDIDEIPSPAHSISIQRDRRGLPSKTDRKKRASIITYPHSVTKHFQNEPAPRSALRFFKIFWTPATNLRHPARASNPRADSKRCRSDAASVDHIACGRCFSAAPERDESRCGNWSVVYSFLARVTHSSPDQRGLRVLSGHANRRRCAR